MRSAVVMLRLSTVDSVVDHKLTDEDTIRADPENSERCDRNRNSSILDNFYFSIERFSFECRKTKTKVITLANHKGHRQYSEPIKTRSNYM